MPHPLDLIERTLRQAAAGSDEPCEVADALAAVRRLRTWWPEAPVSPNARTILDLGRRALADGPAPDGLAIFSGLRDGRPLVVVVAGLEYAATLEAALEDDLDRYRDPGEDDAAGGDA